MSFCCLQHSVFDGIPMFYTDWKWSTAPSGYWFYVREKQVDYLKVLERQRPVVLVRYERWLKYWESSSSRHEDARGVCPIITVHGSLRIRTFLEVWSTSRGFGIFSCPMSPPSYFSRLLFHCVYMHLLVRFFRFPMFWFLFTQYLFSLLINFSQYTFSLLLPSS